MYAFYDFETTGTSPAYDQPLQFAAILTDDDFKELKSVNIRCNLAPHILPSPVALAITKVTPEDLTGQDMTLYEFAQQISRLTSEWAPATWVGYNSLSFDENVMRHMFYQNLVPGIFRTQTDGNKRLDVMKLVMACWAFEAKAIKIPTNDKGKPNIKLDQLAPFNGFADHHAHDALGDVRATIHVTRLIRDGAPEIWTEVMSHFDKQTLLRNLQNGKVYQYIDRFGPRGVGIQLGVYCGTNADNDKRIGFANLTGKKIEALLEAEDDVVERAVTESPLLVRSVDIGAMPLLFPAKNVPDELNQLADRFRRHKEFWQKVGQKLAGRFDDAAPPTEVEDRIFENFPSRADEKKLAEFHKVPWVKRAAILKDVTDARLRELGGRLMAMYAPEHAEEEAKTAFWLKIARRWNGDEFYGAGPKNPGNTHASVQRDLEAVASGERFQLEASELEAIRDFFEKRRL